MTVAVSYPASISEHSLPANDNVEFVFRESHIAAEFEAAKYCAQEAHAAGQYDDLTYYNAQAQQFRNMLRAEHLRETSRRGTRAATEDAR